VRQRPHRHAPVPAADALAPYGRQCAVALVGGTWALVGAEPRPAPTCGPWRARCAELAAEHPRVRIYNRAGRCVRDTADEGGPRP
jgi:hypothetical protein